MTLKEMLLNLEKNYIYCLEYYEFEWTLTTYVNGKVSYENSNKYLKNLMEEFTGIKCNTYYEELADIQGAMFKIYMSNDDKSYLNFKITRQYEICKGWEKDLTNEISEVELENIESLVEFLLESESQVAIAREEYWGINNPMEAYGLFVSDFV